MAMNSIRQKASLAQALQRLGFTDHEARAYATLSQTAPATAYEIAKISGLPRANAYNVLRALEAKGAIQPVTENPVRYVPVDPERYFGQIEKSTTTLCDSVVRELQTRTGVDDSVYVSVYRGSQQVNDKLSELIQSARKHVWIKAPTALISPFQDAITQAARRGIEIRIVAFGDNIKNLKTHPDITVIPHEGDGVPHGAADVLFTITVDFDGVMIVSYAKDAIGSYARNHSIVYVIQTLMLHEVYFSEMYAVFGNAIDARFGKQLAKLRKKYRPEGMERFVLEGL